MFEFCVRHKSLIVDLFLYEINFAIVFFFFLSSMLFLSIYFILFFTKLIHRFCVSHTLARNVIKKLFYSYKILVKLFGRKYSIGSAV